MGDSDTEEELNALLLRVVLLRAKVAEVKMSQQQQLGNRTQRMSVSVHLCLCVCRVTSSRPPQCRPSPGRSVSS